jgi:hypothetical protein
MTKNQLAPTKAPAGIAGGVATSNKINFLRRLFDLEKTLNNSERIQSKPYLKMLWALGFVMCFDFDGQHTIVLPIADFMSPAKRNDRQYQEFLDAKITHYTGFFELKASAL